MSSDQRQAQRHNDFIAVSVTAHDTTSGRKLAGPVGGRIINISRQGACLLMSPVNPETGGIPGASATAAKPLLEIKGALPQGEKSFTLAAHPIWTVPMIMDDLHGLRMGVEFATRSEDEQEAIIAALIHGQ